jgi:hypothetical protein
MDLITRFISEYGYEKYEQISNYIEENNLLDEYNFIKNNTQELFYFSIKYGIFEIVKFLYEDVNIEYDNSILHQFSTVINSSDIPNRSNSIPITTGSTNTKLNVQVVDKFTRNRNKCIHYLIYMYRYSKLRRENKKFYYRFNKKNNISKI